MNTKYHHKKYSRIFNIALSSVVVLLSIELYRDYRRLSRARKMKLFEKVTLMHSLSEERVKEKLSPAQYERRVEANELDGFPTNALLES